MPRFPPRELLHVLRDVKNVDEQCAILKKGDAAFYENPGDYPPIADLFKDEKRDEGEKKEL
jgi:hypothetical protein